MTGRVLVTGATGAIGSELVRTLLATTSADVVLLLRADSASELENRRRTVVDYTAGDEQRVSAVGGDVTAMHLGIDTSIYDELSHTVTHLIHAAANVNLRMSDQEAKTICVDATQGVLNFCDAALAAGQFEKLEYISTLGVAGNKPGAIPEHADLGPRAFNTAYESSKARAEATVWSRAQAGFPVTVHRPSMVIGDSTTGRIRHFQIFYYICEFLSGKYTRGILPDPGDVLLDTVPVDFVAQAIVHAMHDPDTSGRILHLCAGQDRAMRVRDLATEVAKVFRACGRFARQRMVPLGLFRFATQALTPFVNERMRRAINNLPMLLVHLDANQRFENHQTLQLLAAAHLQPPPAQDYVPLSLRYYVDHKVPS